MINTLSNNHAIGIYRVSDFVAEQISISKTYFKKVCCYSKKMAWRYCETEEKIGEGRFKT